MLSLLPSISSPNLHTTIPASCYIQGYTIQLCSLSSYLWTTCFAFHLYQIIWRQNKTPEMYEWRYVLLAWGLPSLIIMAFIVQHAGGFPLIGFGGLPWCWIRSWSEGKWSDIGFHHQLIFFYVPLLCIAILNMGIFIFLAFKLGSTTTIMPTNLEDKIRRRMAAYLGIFLLTSMWGALGRAFQVISPGHELSPVILALTSFFSPLQGFLNCITYGLNRALRIRIRTFLRHKLRPTSVPLVGQHHTPLLRSPRRSHREETNSNMEKANGGLCPAILSIKMEKNSFVAGENLDVSWSIALTNTPTSSAFKLLDSASLVTQTGLYLCPEQDHKTACTNRIDLVQPPLTGTLASGVSTFMKSVAFSTPGTFSLMAKATLAPSNTQESPSSFIEFATYRGIQVNSPPESNGLAIGLGIGGGVLFVIAVIALLCFCQRRRLRTEQQLASYAGAYIVRSTTTSRSFAPSRTRIPSHYSSQKQTQDGRTKSDHSSFDLKLTHYSEPSESPASIRNSSLPNDTPSYLNFAMSPLVEDEMDFSSSVSFSSLEAPQSFDDGFENYALSPLVDSGFGTGFNDGTIGMEMVQEEDSDEDPTMLEEHGVRI